MFSCCFLPHLLKLNSPPFPLCSCLTSPPVNWLLLLRARSLWSSRTTWCWSKPTWGGKRRPWPKHSPSLPSCPRLALLPPACRTPAKGEAVAPAHRATPKTVRRKNDSFSSLCSHLAPQHVNTTPVLPRMQIWPPPQGFCGPVSHLHFLVRSSPLVISGGSTEL